MSNQSLVEEEYRLSGVVDIVCPWTYQSNNEVAFWQESEEVAAGHPVISSCPGGGCRYVTRYSAFLMKYFLLCRISKMRKCH